ncbi:FBXW5 [Mytilus edulis]|uniref:FBXW5 n=1 Tax=Mytilus edulis TaxID=6550 RepID=A0A8S3SKU5_MYTED|nr:FBXW5 [Mytilus edulis]
MPLHCVEDRRSPTEIEEDEDSCPSIWQQCPDSILLHIFSFLEAKHLTASSQTCKDWNRVTNDESLWKYLLDVKWGVKNQKLPPSKESWRSEYKRLDFHTPIHLSETLTDHDDEVLHVSFSHDGKLFCTTSKDATIKVWNVGDPTTIKHTKNFRDLLSWDFTQFSCFNQIDTLLLVSSVKTTDFMDRRGYVAIISLPHDFRIIRVVSMDPSQLFGSWLDNSTFLGGCLEISLDRFTTTVQIESFDVPDGSVEIKGEEKENLPEVEEGTGRNLFTFCSETASLIKFLTVAHIPVNGDKGPQLYCDKCASQEKDSNPRKIPKRDQTLFTSDIETHSVKSLSVLDGNELDKNESASCSYSSTSAIKENNSLYHISLCNQCQNGNVNRNLIFVTGEFAVALHQLGFKNVSPAVLDLPMSPSDESVQEGESHMVVNFSNNDITLRPIRISDKPDNLLDLFGHVTGLTLSNDHRYLFLNCRPWIGKVDRTDPWATPDLSPSIEIRVIDLCTLQDTGRRYQGHKGFSPSTMCCFVFLDVSPDYVGSGSEDAKGYLWDKHYCVNLATFEHSFGVVNAVGFNPANQEYLVTVSDDCTIKIWRSKALMKDFGRV